MDEIRTILERHFRFTKRPSPIPGDYRPAWRMILIVLILWHAHGKKSSLQKLHVLSWAAKTSESRRRLVDYLGGQRRHNDLLPRVDPSLNRALDFAIGEGLVTIEGGKSLRLTPAGTTIAEEILGAGDSFIEEIKFLREVGRKATEPKVDDLLTWSEVS